MPLLHLEPLPPRTTKLDLIALLGGAGLDRRYVGRIELLGRSATVEVPEQWAVRLVKALDGFSMKEQRLRVRSSGAAGCDDDHFPRMLQLLELEAQAELHQ